ncbi:MAG: hypothetical protein CFH01_00348 [Alphaproteobacteria bacterium MarineAlpha2_Bin1]|nr:MAG: hypothetical protein CFH01_00348 [Alphaproteobacteria bacterium MarineAlpha2_Bin1]
MKYSVPKLSANEDEVKVVKLNFNDGDFVEQGMVIAELESTKSTMEILSEKNEKIFYFVQEEEICKIGDLLAEQSNKKREIIKEKTDDFIITEDAKILMNKYNLSKDQFKNKKIIRTKDVEDFVKLDLDKNEEKKPELKFPLLSKYIFKPTASMEVKYSLKNIVDPEADFWSRLFSCEINTQLNTEYIHNFIYDGKTLHLFPITKKNNLKGYRSALDNASLEVYRGKSIISNPVICVSFLKSDLLEFSHIPLLYSESIITIGVAENNINKEIIINLSYDHSYLDGYTLLKLLEKIIS